MSNIKMTVAESMALCKEEMATVLGGRQETQKSCGCACAYENKGGSTTAANQAANAAQGLHSPGMSHQWYEQGEDGAWYPADYWV